MQVAQYVHSFISFIERFHQVNKSDRFPCIIKMKNTDILEFVGRNMFPKCNLPVAIVAKLLRNQIRKLRELYKYVPPCWRSTFVRPFIHQLRG